MKKCPKCGAPLHDEIKMCLACDWVDPKKKNNVKSCPECGETLIKGVCYRCGYRDKHSHNTCPHCRQKLIAGRCDRCDYVAPTKNPFRIALNIFMIIIVLGIIFWILERAW